MPPPPAKQFSGIFVCYRREDSEAYADRLLVGLRNRFGEDRVFIDIDSIKPGGNFVKVIEDAISSCEILVAIIGSYWLSSTDKKGRRRLDKPDDFVRLEITTALKHEIDVVPVLVQGASMPSTDDLPDDLAELAHLSAMELNRRYWDQDVDLLLNRIGEILDDKRQAHERAVLQEEEESQRQKAEAGKLDEARKREEEEAARLEEERQKRGADEREVHRRSEAALFRDPLANVSSGRVGSAGRGRAFIIAASISLVVVLAALGVWLQFGRQWTGQGSTGEANANSSPHASDSPAPSATQPTKTESPVASQKNSASTNAVNTNRSVAAPSPNRLGRTTQSKQDNDAAQRQKCALAELENRRCPP